MLLPSVTLTEQLYQRSGEESTGRGGRAKLPRQGDEVASRA